MINYLINQFKWTSHLIPIHTSLTHLLRYIILQQCSRLSPKDTMRPPSWLFSFTLRHGIMSSVQKKVSSSHLSYCFAPLIHGKFPWVMLNHPCSHFSPLKDQPTGPASKYVKTLTMLPCLSCYIGPCQHHLLHRRLLQLPNCSLRLLFPTRIESNKAARTSVTTRQFYPVCSLLKRIQRLPISSSAHTMTNKTLQDHIMMTFIMPLSLSASRLFLNSPTCSYARPSH